MTYSFKTVIKSANFTGFLNSGTKVLHIILVSFFLLSAAQGQSQGLFDSDEEITLYLKGDIKNTLNDRGDDSPYHPVTLHYRTEVDTISIPLKIKTRGHFRKMSSNCKYPPILLNFKKSAPPKESIFHGQDKVKLVTPCRGDKYVIHEYLVYKLYNLITPNSFNVRLAKVILQDTVKNKDYKPFYGFLIEEEKQMAKRNQSSSLKKIGLRPQHIQKEEFLKMAIFEYMIGNTDWSIQYQQNIKLITTDSISLPIAIPYDFDHAGIVRAPYAKPAPELQLSSTQHRRYRGYCIPEMDQFAASFDTFNRLKADIYAVYEGNPLLSNKYQTRTRQFLDRFYETINDPKKAQKAFSYPCDKSGTGNIIIKGLKKNE